MIDTRVLLVSPDSDLRERFPREAKVRDRQAQFEPVAYVHEALRMLADRPYGAVVFMMKSLDPDPLVDLVRSVFGRFTEERSAGPASGNP